MSHTVKQYEICACIKGEHKREQVLVSSHVSFLGNSQTRSLVKKCSHRKDHRICGVSLECMCLDCVYTCVSLIADACIGQYKQAYAGQNAQFILDLQMMWVPYQKTEKRMGWATLLAANLGECRYWGYFFSQWTLGVFSQPWGNKTNIMLELSKLLKQNLWNILYTRVSKRTSIGHPTFLVTDVF